MGFKFPEDVLLSILLITLVLIEESGSNTKSHWLNEPEVVYHLGTKTPYRVVANYNDSLVEYPGCKPVKIFGIVRHGTRTPGEKVVKKVISNVELGIWKDVISFFRGKTWENEVAREWSSLLDSETEKILTPEGGKEMVLLAQRFQRRFPTLLPKTFSNSSYLFKFTATERTQESARHFAIGLFGEDGSKNVWFPQPLKKDPILRFYKLCDRWTKEVKKNPMTKYELKKYKETAEVKQMLKDVSSRIYSNYSLSFDTVHHIFVACAFETAWYPGMYSQWCTPFTKKDMEVLEYFEELKYFWRDGYGFDLNHKQACPLLQNVMDFFSDKREQKANFYFTHSGTLLKVLSHIGLYKDDFKLAHDTDPQLRMRRNWKVSEMNSFGNNLVFVLFRCKDGEKLLTLHQERPVVLNGCPEEELCPITTAHKVLHSSSNNNCDFKRLCSL